jgi:hypothetical protein
MDPTINLNIFHQHPYYEFFVSSVGEISVEDARQLQLKAGFPVDLVGVYDFKSELIEDRVYTSWKCRDTYTTNTVFVEKDANTQVVISTKFDCNTRSWDSVNGRKNK